MSSEPRDQYLAVCDELQRVVAERDALRALLNEAQGFIQPDTGWDYTTDAGGYLYDRIERALAGEKNNGAS